MPSFREDLPLMAFAIARGKWKYVCAKIEHMFGLGRPILVGTTSVENSEHLSAMRKEIKSSLLTSSRFTRSCKASSLKEKVGGIKKTWNELSSLNHWLVKDYYRLVNSVTALEPYIEKLSDEQLKAKTVEFRQRLKGGATLADIQAEAFAVVREAAKRKLGMRHFDVQIIGGAVLHDGSIAEMKTGEGKTFVSTLAAYLNALRGDGDHVVTVNDYLAQRDAEWMGRVHRFLGLSVGLIQRGMTNEDRRSNYRCDITYTNNTELGFDYLQDNLAGSREQLVMRWPKPFHFGIVDEVDSVLIDEGRNPLLISGEHYNVDLKDNSVELTEDGILLAEIALETNDLWDENDPWARFVLNALRAKEFYRRDVQYIIRDGKAPIINESVFHYGGSSPASHQPTFQHGDTFRILEGINSFGHKAVRDMKTYVRRLHALLYGNTPEWCRFGAVYTWPFSCLDAPHSELEERPYFHGIWPEYWYKAGPKPFVPSIEKFFTECKVSNEKALYYWPHMNYPTSIEICKNFLHYEWRKHGLGFNIFHVRYISMGFDFAEAFPDFGIPIGKCLTKQKVSFFVRAKLEKMVVNGRHIGLNIHPEINCEYDPRNKGGPAMIRYIKVSFCKMRNGVLDMVIPHVRYSGGGCASTHLILPAKPGPAI